MKTIHSFLENSAERLPSKEALIFGDRRLTYSEVNGLADRIRNFVCAKTQKQDAVVLFLDNSIEFVCSYFGILKAGCVCVPMDINTTDEHLLFKARDSGAKLILSREKFLEKIKRSGVLEVAKYADVEEGVPGAEACRRDVSEEDVCSILYTSGTTGDPKGVMLRHKNVVAATENIVGYIGISEDDIDVNALPYTHSFGLGHIHCYFRRGGKVIVHQNFINLPGILEKIKKEKATSFSAPPAVLKLLVDHYRERLSECTGLRYIVSNTSFMPKETGLSLMDILKGAKIYMYYGLTEASRSTFNLYNENREKVESVGKATPNVEVMVVDDGMNELPANQTGEVIIRGRHVIDCYWKNKKETEKSIVNGWLKTGDMGYFDSEGYLWLVGRKDHIINVSGEKVAPREIEKVVSCSPGVKEAAAVGVPDEMFNEVVKVFVVKEGDATADDIIRFCRGKLESYKIPRFVEFVDSLPRTEAGKLRRGLLR